MNIWFPRSKLSTSGQPRRHSPIAAESSPFLAGTVEASEYEDEETKMVEVTISDEVLTKPQQKLRLFKSEVLPMNSEIVDDMTSLKYLHEPAIISNLRERSNKDKPYTFLGAVLVSVNPLKMIPDPIDHLGRASVLHMPHPFSIAELAFQQMKLAKDQASGDCPVNQSIIICGESGAGKSEAYKRVIRHLALRGKKDMTSDTKDGADQRLLNANPILEAFGNASTTCNHNSSRFGKFTKLRFSQCQNAESSSFVLDSALLQTYLLERSRVTCHFKGERSFHIFYQICEGISSDLRPKLGLFENTESAWTHFKYLQPIDRKHESTICTKKTHSKQKDQSDFSKVSLALEKLRISGEEHVYPILAAILHLGNIEFGEEENSVRILENANTSKIQLGSIESLNETSGKHLSSLTWASKLLGVKTEELKAILLEKKIHVGNEVVVTKLNATSASNTRHSIARNMYSYLFNWVVQQINKAINFGLANDLEDYIDSNPIIGILDIFGFESLTLNSLEQLLINYTNEVLEGVFKEHELYKAEGLTLKPIPKPAIKDSLSLLKGTKSSRYNPGILKTIETETNLPQPTDEKMLKTLNRKFLGHKCFPPVHPRCKDVSFIVFHYADQVTYTVGEFLQKNMDEMPKSASSCFRKSTNFALAEMSLQFVGKSRVVKQGIVYKFQLQIEELLRDLTDSARCSFIRCINPNTMQLRQPGSVIDEWFDESNVRRQLRCLSIPETAQVLKSGFPTRISYEELGRVYKKILPSEVLQRWELVGGRKGDHKMFAKALLFGLEVDTNRLCAFGNTKIFFRTGMLSKLDQILVQAKTWSVEDGKISDGNMIQRREFSRRFFLYYARRSWRRAFAKVQCYNRFLHILHTKRQCATLVQSLWRMYTSMRRYGSIVKVTIWCQKKYRSRMLYRDQWEASIKIQSFLRKRHHRLIYLSKRKLAYWCQQRFHRKLALLANKKKSVVLLQAFSRRSMAFMKYRKTIAAIRKFQQLIHYRLLKLRSLNAVVKLQAFFRGKVEKQNYEIKKRVALLCQRYHWKLAFKKGCRVIVILQAHIRRRIQQKLITFVKHTCESSKLVKNKSQNGAITEHNLEQEITRENICLVDSASNNATTQGEVVDLRAIISNLKEDMERVILRNLKLESKVKRLEQKVDKLSQDSISEQTERAYICDNETDKSFEQESTSKCDIEPISAKISFTRFFIRKVVTIDENFKIRLRVSESFSRLEEKFKISKKADTVVKQVRGNKLFASVEEKFSSSPIPNKLYESFQRQLSHIESEVAIVKSIQVA